MPSVGLFVLCAGLGSRLLPLTSRMAKPLLPICGVPLLTRILQHTTFPYTLRCANVHHLPAQVEALCQKEGIQTFFEPVILGSGGCMGYAASAWKNLTHVLVHNGDILHDFDIDGQIPKLTLRSDTIYLFASQQKGIQNLEVNADNYLQRVLPRSPLPSPAKNRYAFCGIALIPKSFWEIVPTFPCDVKALWMQYIQNGGHIQVVPQVEDTWFDIGTPTEFAEAVFFVQKKNRLAKHHNTLNTPIDLSQTIDETGKGFSKNILHSIVLEQPKHPDLWQSGSVIGHDFVWPIN